MRYLIEQIKKNWKLLLAFKVVKLAIMIVVFFLSSSFLLKDTEVKPWPSVQLTDLEGKPINTKDFVKNGKPAYVAFWATWCVNCFKELKVINDNYSEWQKLTGGNIYAVSIDDARTKARVGAVVKKKAWEFNVVLDTKKELSNKLGVKMPPNSFIVDKNGKIVWSHLGYKPGDEQKALEVLQSLQN